MSPLHTGHTQDTSQAGVLKQVLLESLVETQRTSEEDVTFYWVLRPGVLCLNHHLPQRYSE